ncbi:MAG: glycosyltransferase family 2 protein [Methanobacteriaceae archaeon]
MMPNVAIIILNWNGWKDTIECLESLYQIDYPNYNVIVVDNASEDDSITKIKKYCEGEIEVKSDFFEYNKNNKPINIFKFTNEESEKVKIIDKKYGNLNSCEKLILIKNDKNYGFAEGNNIGIRFSLKNLKPDYILLLNNDTVVDASFLLELVKVGEQNERNGILGPKVYNYYHKDTFQVTKIKLNFNTGKSKLIGLNEKDYGQYNKILNTDYVPGSCFLIKSSLLEKVPQLNADYFCYWEEVDFCIRTRKAGYNCLYVPNAKIWHKISQTSNQYTGFLNYYLTRNMFWFMKKYSNNYNYFIIYFFICRFLLQLISFSIHKNNFKLIKCYLKGVKDGLIK